MTQWPGTTGTVRVQPFWAGVPSADSAVRIVCYAGKHAMKLKLDGGRDYIEVPWPMPVQAVYWQWIHSMRNGLASLRLQINRTAKTSRIAQ